MHVQVLAEPARQVVPSVPELIDACQAFIARINRDPVAVVDRLWPKFELDPEFEEKLRVST